MKLRATVAALTMALGGPVITGCAAADTRAEASSPVVESAPRPGANQQTVRDKQRQREQHRMKALAAKAERVARRQAERAQRVQVEPSPPQEVEHATRACTQTSSGTCIHGGQFCPQASYGQRGWDAAERRYVCTGNEAHPHWETP